MKQRSLNLRRAAVIAAAAAMLAGGAAWAQTASGGVTACLGNSGLIRAATDDGTCKTGEEAVRLASQPDLDQLTARVAALEASPGSGSSTPTFTHITLHRQPQGLVTGPCIEGPTAGLPDQGWSKWSSARRCDETDSTVGVVELNEAMFPDGAEATVRYVIREHDPMFTSGDREYDLGICAELYNIDTQTTVEGSDTCGRSSVQAGMSEMDATFVLPDSVDRQRLMWRYRAEYVTERVEYSENWVEYEVVPAGSIVEVTVEVVG